MLERAATVSIIAQMLLLLSLPLSAATSQEPRGFTVTSTDSRHQLARSPLNAGLKNSYMICTEDLPYSPHYDFTDLAKPSYARALFQLFTEKTGITLEVKALPTKRLGLDAGCDARYPDNPLWYEGATLPKPAFFSLALTQIVGATLVLKNQRDITAEQLRAVSVPRGFTPHHLIPLQRQHSFVFIETSDASAALQMVLKGRVNAADVEWNVAQALLLPINAQTEIVIAKNLPIAEIGFHLSSATESSLIRIFDQFLRQNADEVLQLKQQFQLREQISDLTTVEHPTDATQN